MESNMVVIFQLPIKVEFTLYFTLQQNHGRLARKPRRKSVRPRNMVNQNKENNHVCKKLTISSGARRDIK